MMDLFGESFDEEYEFQGFEDDEMEDDGGALESEEEGWCRGYE